MGLLSNIFGSLKSRYRTYLMGGPAVYQKIGVNESVKKGFLGNSAVYAIVMKDANKFASIPKYVYDVKESEEKAADIKLTGAKKALNDLINRPNPYQSQDAFFAMARASYKATGECFIWLNRGDVMDEEGNPLPDEEIEKMPILEMYVLPSNMVSIEPDKDDIYGVNYYVLETSTRAKFTKASILHWKTPTLEFDEASRPHLRGLSPLTPGYKTLQQNTDATDSSVRMIQKDGSKGALYNETFNNLSPEQISGAKAAIDSNINTNAVKGSIATLPGKWGYVNFGMSSIDLQLLEAKKLSTMELCFLFDVPYTFFDPNTAFANSEWQKKNWITDSIIPSVKQFDGELNRCLLKAFGLEGVCFIASDFSELPELQEDMEKKARALSIAWWISPNQKSKDMGYDPNPNPLFDEPWFPTGYTPLSHMIDDDAENILNRIDE